MNLLNQQAQLFIVAATLFLLGLLILYAALGVYALLVEKALNLFGLHGALVAYILEKRNRNAWWRRPTDWWAYLTHFGGRR